MAWSNEPQSLEYNDEERYDRERGMPDDYESPEYPGNMCFSITMEDLEKAGCVNGDPDDEMMFSAMGTVTSTFHGRESCRIELEVAQFAGEDGKFFDLSQPVHLCLCESELEKISLDDGAERGDTIHLIGRARLENKSSSEYGGDMACLQITHLTYEENESAESREG